MVKAKTLNHNEEIQFNIYSEDYGVHGIHDKLIDFGYYENASIESKLQYYHSISDKPKVDSVIQNDIISSAQNSIAFANEERINKIRSDKKIEDRIYTNTNNTYNNSSNRNSLEKIIINSKYYYTSGTGTSSSSYRNSSPNINNKRSSMNIYGYIENDRTSSLINNNDDFDNLLDDENNDGYDSGKDYMYSDIRKKTRGSSIDEFNLLENNMSGYNTSNSSLLNSKTSSPNSKMLFRKGLCGLFNIGNTCYMNSVIQCLNNCTELTNYIRNDKYVECLKMTKCKSRITEAYASVINEMWSKNISDYINPSILKNAISINCSQFIGCSQNDSHEFLSYLLDGMNEELTVKPKRSIISETFEGKYISKIQCECGNCSITNEMFISLTLPIPTVEINKALPKYSENLINFRNFSFRILFYEDPLITPIMLYVTPLKLTIRSMKTALITVMNLSESSILHVAQTYINIIIIIIVIMMVK